MRDSKIGVAEITSLIRSILDGERPDLSALDAPLAEALGDLAERLDSLSSEIVELSPSDELTSLVKEEVFNNVLWREFNRSERYREPLSLALVEVEGLDALIERGDRARADMLLRKVAGVILQMVRETDLAARYGDLLAVVMPQTAHKGALEFAQRLRNAVEAEAVEINGGGATPRVFVGAASVPDESTRTVPDFVGKASAALDASRSAAP